MTITVANEYGEWATSPMLLDLAMARYLPASPNELRRQYIAEHPAADGLYANVGTVTEWLVMLASTSGPNRESQVYTR